MDWKLVLAEVITLDPLGVVAGRRPPIDDGRSRTRRHLKVSGPRAMIGR
jgi:hypothetical protein